MNIQKFDPKYRFCEYCNVKTSTSVCTTCKNKIVCDLCTFFITDLSKLIINKLINKDYYLDRRSILIIGKRATGKSILVLDLLQKSHSKTGIVISPLENANLFYSKIVPPEMIRKTYSMEFNKSLLKIQDPYDNTKNNIAIVFDGCPMDYKSREFKNLIINGRQYHLTPIVTITGPMA